MSALNRLVMVRLFDKICIYAENNKENKQIGYKNAGSRKP